MDVKMKFDLPKDKASIIKVIGVGGGGGNAVNHMQRLGIKGVDFFVCNTDSQALELSPVPNKIQIGGHLTEGRGAGSNPDMGKKAALESIEEIIELLGVHTKMLFVTAGMGGGTGTGAAPIIAQTAKEMGILTVGIVTTPFSFEGSKRQMQAEEGLAEIKEAVDSLLVISNDRIKEMYGNLPLSKAFGQADDVLATAAKGIAEIITVSGDMNVDFEDVKTAMMNSGVAIMGRGMATGEGRAMEAALAAITSPLLNDDKIKGAKNILINISYGTDEVLMDEITQINEFFQEQAGMSANLKWGHCMDETLDDQLSVTIIATGFETRENKFRNQPEAEFTFEITNDDEDIIEEEKDAQTHIEFEAQQAEVKQKRDTEESEAERVEKMKQRMIHLRNLNSASNNPAAADEIEKEPAYKRRNIKLEDVPHSSESQISKFSLNEEDEDSDKPEIRPNNSFLHDNVD